MFDGDIEQDQVFVHKSTGGRYVAINSTTYTKEPGHPDRQETLMKTGEEGTHKGWIAAVVYYPEGDPSKMFVRSETHFRAKFERA